MKKNMEANANFNLAKADLWKYYMKLLCGLKKVGERRLSILYMT